MKEIILRELTDVESQKLNSFVANESTDIYQYFLAIIVTDLIPEGEVTLEKALGKISKGYPNCDPKEEPFSVYGLIDAWIRLCMEYKNYGLVDSLDKDEVRGLRNNINVLINGFINSVWYDVDIGKAGKKQTDLENAYTKLVMKGLPKWTDITISVEPELMYRFVMTVIEDLGFRLIVQSDNTRCVDLTMFRGVEF